MAKRSFKFILPMVPDLGIGVDDNVWFWYLQLYEIYDIVNNGPVFYDHFLKTFFGGCK